MQAVDLFREAAIQKASDLHLVPGCPPMLRIDGQLMPMHNCPIFTAEQTQQFILQLLTDAQRTRLAEDYSVDFTLSHNDVRYRGSALFQRNGLEAVLRLVPTNIPSPEDLQLPTTITELANLRSGLVLVTGPTGSGKSTTLACLLDLINQRRRGNIITIEDPIEFVHSNKNCIVSQREIGIHAKGFNVALRSVMRQDPDVVMIGEMRDLETIAAAITVAETGHLVLATLHSTDAALAVDRMIDVFPARQQQQIRTQLAGVLSAVIAQSLIPRARGGGRIAVREIMIVNQAISTLIRSARTHEIYSAIEMGAREGMVSLNRALADLAKRGLVDPQDLNDRQTGVHTGHRRRTTENPGSSASA